MTLSDQHNYNENEDCVFDAEFHIGKLRDGRIVSFTQAESALMSHFARHPKQILTRNQLLDAITGSGSDSNDRNIDFLVNRLRRKLGDNARDPKFIATRYGEGYIWIYEPRSQKSKISEAYLVIGPVQGLEAIPDQASLAQDFTRALQSKISSLLSKKQRVAFEEDFNADSDSARSVEVAIALTFFREGDLLECVLTTSSPNTQKQLDSRRIQIDHTESIPDTGLLAQSVLAHAWKELALVEGNDVSLATALFDVPGKQTVTRTEDRESVSETWSESQTRLAALRREFPDDPELKLLYATNLHTKYVWHGFSLFLKGEETCTQDEQMIEQLVLESLPFALSRPKYALQAAKLLHFIDRGHRDHAIRIAESAHTESLSIAASLATIGQLRAFNGDFERALPCLQQAAAISKKGSVFQVFTLTVLCQALRASNNFKELKKAKRKLYFTRPATMIFMEPILTDPKRPSLRAKGAVHTMNKDRAKAFLQFLSYISANQFRNPKHGYSNMESIVNLLVKRFGQSVVPIELSPLMVEKNANFGEF